MQRMWKQSPKQSVGLYDIRLHTKKPSYQKLHGPIGGGGGLPLRLPLDPPLRDRPMVANCYGTFIGNRRWQIDPCRFRYDCE